MRSSQLRHLSAWRLACSFCIRVLLTSQLFWSVLSTADTSISDCNTLLDTTADYDVANDIAEQRNALIEFYNSTGGEYWKTSASSTELRDQVQLVETYLNLIGTLAAQANFSAAALPADTQRVYYALAQLSVGCSLQRTVQLVKLLVKYPWNSDQSYCYWLGVACCQTAGDFFTQYCSLGSQSVAQIFLTDSNLTGTLPASLGTALPDLQLLSLRHNPGLHGRFPDVSPIVAAKFQTLEIRNTSLLQCNASNIVGLESAANGTTVQLGGRGAAVSGDAQSSCLPNFLRFCPSTSTSSSGQQCPSIAFDRPYGVYPLLTSQVNSLSALAAALGTDVSQYAGSNYTTNSTCPTDYTAGGILGSSIGQLTATANMDSLFYSWVGCNCSNGAEERQYNIDTSGKVSMTCISSQMLPDRVPLVSFIVPSVVGGLLLAIALPLAFIYWRRLAGDLATYKQIWHKRRSPPGTLKEGLAEQLGLVAKEVSIVMTDVQGSSRLWEWNQTIMTGALAMHDHLLRELLNHHCGYEVATEGDAFTMAFHDPIDAIAWALNVQHRLLTLPWPAEILEHPECIKQTTADGTNTPIFCGLRVRMAIHTGKPDSMQVHHVTRQIEYHGELMSLTEAIVGFPVGGQVLISGSTYQRIYGRLHTIGPLHPIEVAQGRSRLNRSRSQRRLSSQPKEPPNGLMVVEGRVPSQGELESVLSTAGLLLPTLSVVPATPRLSLSGEAATPGSRGYLADPVTRWGSFTQEQLAAFGFHAGHKGAAHKYLHHTGDEKGHWWSRLWNKGSHTKGQSARVWQRRWAPSQTDVDSMVRSSTPVNQPASCMVVDMGAFNLIEFAKTLGLPAPGLSVTGGVHVLQILSHSLAARATAFAPLDATNKISHTFFDAPGAQAATFVEGKEVTVASQSKPHVTMVFCGPADYKGLFALDAATAKAAMLQFQSCVRTTLLLCDGYECQEKLAYNELVLQDGLFMIAFEKPWAAVEWAVTLQLAMLKVEWSPLLELYELTAEVKDENGGTLMRGLSAKIGIFPGDMAKICPHTSTGRADYFGPAVNRAARLLCAAKAGQILVEETFMQQVVMYWQGSATAAANTVAMQSDQQASAYSGPPDASMGQVDRQGGQAGPQAVDATSLSSRDAETKELPVAGSDSPNSHKGASLTLQLPRSDTVKDQGAVVSWNPSLDPPGPPTQGPDPSFTPNQALSVEAAEPGFLPPQLQSTAASQQPHASTMRMSVNNCHMLQFRLSKAQPDVSPAPKTGVELVTIPAVSTPSLPVAQPAGSKQKAGLLKKQLTYLSVKLPHVSKVQPALVTVTPGGKRRASLVWNEAFASGQPFPEKKVPIQVWSLGRFKFKGIAGTCKVMQVYPTELAGRRQLHDYQLNAGKATMVSQGNVACQYETDISLLDVFDLPISTT